MRFLFGGVLLALAAAPAGAQEMPLIRADGTSLETFGVELRLDGVDHKTPEGLARSFARFQEDQHGVRRRFAELFRDAHLDVLRRYYLPDVVARQAEDYDAQTQKGYRCEVRRVGATADTATALLVYTYIEGGRQREENSEIELKREGESWWIRAIRDRRRDGSLETRDLGVPPAFPRADVGPPRPPDLTSARATVASLRADIVRLGAVRDNASLALLERFFDITAAFYGAKVAEEARAGQERPPAGERSTVEIGDAKARLADLVRVGVAVKEKGGSVGEAAFDLRAEGGSWRIVGEFARPDPDGPFVPNTRNLGLFFLVRR
jgi:hypothetical protein